MIALHGRNFGWDGRTVWWVDEANGYLLGNAHGDGWIPPWELHQRIVGYWTDSFGDWGMA